MREGGLSGGHVSGEGSESGPSGLCDEPRSVHRTGRIVLDLTGNCSLHRSP